MTCYGLSFFSINGCVFKVISCLANRAQFSGYQVKILNLKHVIKHLISEKILTNNCCFEICKQKAFETWLLLFLVVNVTVIIGIFLYNCIVFILKMNLTIQKLHLNLKKEELFIRDNGHEVYLIFLLSMLFFSFVKNPRRMKSSQYRETTSISNLCWSHTNQTNRTNFAMTFSKVRWW